MFGIYTTPQILTKPISTNAFSYEQRAALLDHPPQITITPRAFGTRDDIMLGDHSVIEEIDHTGSLQSQTGLRENIHIEGPTPIAIMDNHNHALGIRREHITNATNQPTVIHIDAHADLEAATEPFPAHPTTDQTRHYIHTQTHIGSFIRPALESGLISDCLQIRSSYTLEHLTLEADTTYILDIDLDFRALEPSIPNNHRHILQNIISSTSSAGSLIVITIATSPYFLDQHKALRFLGQLREILS